MPTTASRTSGNYEKAPIGNQQAVCVFVSDIGMQAWEYEGNPTIRHQVVITWELLATQTQGQNAGKPFLVSQFYTLSLNEKARLCKDLESWRGKKFTEEELKGFDLDSLIGANCLLNIIETKNNNRSVGAIAPLPKGMEKLNIVHKEMPESLAKWIEELRSKAVQGSLEPENENVGEGLSKDDLPF